MQGQILTRRAILSIILLVTASFFSLSQLNLLTQVRGAFVTRTTISTLAGGGLTANVGAKQAPMVKPSAVALDPLGRGFYVVDETESASLLRFVNTSATAVTLAGATINPGSINLVAGGGVQSDDQGAPARDADLAEVMGLAVDPSGNAVYLTIPSFGAIRAVNVGTQNLTLFGKTVAPGQVATIAKLDQVDLRSVAIHPTTRELYYIAIPQVYKLDANGNPVPVAGGGSPSSGNGDGGQATQARLTTPMALAFDSSNNLLIAEGGSPRVNPPNGAIRRVAPTGVISTLISGLDFPQGLTTTANGDAFAILGNAQQLVRITRTGARSVVAGTGMACDQTANPACGDGNTAAIATLNVPEGTLKKTMGLAADANGVFLPDFQFRRVRYINLSQSAVTILGTRIGAQAINSVVGNGLLPPYDSVPAPETELDTPTGVTADPSGNLYVTDAVTGRLRFVNRSAQPVTLFATTPYVVTVQPGQIVTLNRASGEPIRDDRITTAELMYPQGLLATDKGVFVADSRSGALIKIPANAIAGRKSGMIRFLNTSSSEVVFFPGNADARVVVPPGQIKDIAGVRAPANPQTVGDGMPANTVAFFPTDIALDGAGNIYVADQGNNRIRRIDGQNGLVSTVYGDGQAATLNRATGIAFDSTGRLHIADTRNNRVLRQNAPGGADFTTIANETMRINNPRDLTVDNSGKVFVVNAGTQQVLDLFAAGNELGATSVVAGTGARGFAGDGGPGEQAQLNFPEVGVTTNDIQITANIFTLANGAIVFADTGNNRVRLLRRVEQPQLTLVNVSSASFAGTEQAMESISAAFGASLAMRAEKGRGTPLPTTLVGTTVRVKDAAGTERTAPLFFVSPNQVNYQIPPGTVAGAATVTVVSGDGSISTGPLNVSTTAPGLFSINSMGRDTAAAMALRIKADGTQNFEPVAVFDPAQNTHVPVQLDLGPESDQVFLMVYGTGVRFRSDLNNVKATIGGAVAEVTFAGAMNNFVGLDQINVRLPRSLAGRGRVDIAVTVDGKAANVVTVLVK